MGSAPQACGVRADLEAYMQECERMEMVEAPSSEEPSSEEQQQVQEEIALLRTEEARLLERQAQLAARKRTLKAEHRKGHTINLARVPVQYEPEACVLDKVNDTTRLPAYNAQLVVDVKTHLITACDAVHWSRMRPDRNDPAVQRGTHAPAGRGDARGRAKP